MQNIQPRDDRKQNDEKQSACADNETNSSRRIFLRRVLSVGAAGMAAAGVLAGCGDGGGGEETAQACDTSGLSEQEMARREALKYVSQTPKPNQRCDNCQFWQPDQVEGTCGGCQILPGPVHPAGWCSSWVQGPTS